MPLRDVPRRSPHLLENGFEVGSGIAGGTLAELWIRPKRRGGVVEAAEDWPSCGEAYGVHGGRICWGGDLTLNRLMGLRRSMGQGSVMSSASKRALALRRVASPLTWIQDRALIITPSTFILT
jgi:hypothetical protein